MKKLLFILIASCLFCYTQAQHKEYIADSTKGIPEKLEAWQDLKFGLLMHWGTYSQWGIVESWSICPEDLSWAAYGRKKGIAENYVDYVKAYEKLQTTFNPTQFDPDRWAKAAQDAGMKYVVFTTKHHDGFCMFDSKYTQYKITDAATPFHKHPKKNITLEIFNAFRKYNFWTGAYFSKPDWHSPDYWWPFFPPSDRNCNYSIKKYPEKWKKFTDYTHNQIEELMSNYGKVDILWLDGGWVRKTDSLEVMNYLKEEYEGSRWARNPQNQDIQMSELVKKVRAKQADVLVVDRAVTGPYQNYLTPEQHIPEEGLPYPWETCMTMATSWSYVPNDVYKPLPELITKLVDIVSKGGNFLLNIGPSPEGTIDDAAYDRMKGMGIWLKHYGEAIYGTRKYDVFGEENGIRYTRSKDKQTIYVFVPANLSGSITLLHIPFNKKNKATHLQTNKAVGMSMENNHVRMELPKLNKPDEEVFHVIKIQQVN